MRLRPLGRTGIQVSECTLGTALLGSADRAEAENMLALAFERGINAVEIDGLDREAIRLVGEAVRGLDVHVFARAASLTPFDLPSPHIHVDRAYPGRWLRTQTEELLKQLGVERLGLLLLHAWCPEWLHEGDWLETAGRLREEGKIAGLGVSLFDHDVEAGLETAASGAIDAVQAMHNIFDPSPAAALFPICQKHGVGVIARSPFYYGALAGPLRDFAAGDWRGAYFYPEHRREIGERVRAIASGAPTAELALRFALSHPAVTTVALGMRTRAQLEANLQALAKGPLDADSAAALAKHAWLC